MSRFTLPPLRTTRATLTALVGLCVAPAWLPAQAQEVGRVISSTPVIHQVAVPRQVCSQSQVVSPGQKSGAGAAMGAIAGGAVGNSIGSGGGRAAATMLGIFGGAIMGDKVEGAPAPEVRNVQNCTNQVFYENRTVGYHVVYEFAGKQYSVQMPSDPGPTVRLQITPVASPPVTAAPLSPAVISTPSSPLPPVPVPAGSPMPVPPPGSAPQS